MDRISGKITRAKGHLTELKLEVKNFFDSNPYQIGTKRNPDTRQLIYYIVSAKDVPEKISLITGDIIQNLRSALDHLAYQLFRSNTPTGDEGTHIYFPIADNILDYESKRDKRTRGMSKVSIGLIDEIKPYKDGNTVLWQIHKLNNIDKHRLLVTVGNALDSMNIGAYTQELVNKLFPQKKYKISEIFIRPADNLFPLKVGDVLFVDTPNAKEIPHMKFKLGIVINEPPIIEGEPLMESLERMVTEVENVSSFLLS